MEDESFYERKHWGMIIIVILKKRTMRTFKPKVHRRVTYELLPGINDFIDSYLFLTSSEHVYGSACTSLKLPVATFID